MVRKCSNFEINSLIDWAPVKFRQEEGRWIVIILKYYSTKDTLKFIDIATISSNKYGVGEVKAGLYWWCRDSSGHITCKYWPDKSIHNHKTKTDHSQNHDDSQAVVSGLTHFTIETCLYNGSKQLVLRCIQDYCRQVKV